jgi:hypothetical protein
MFLVIIHAACSHPESLDSPSTADFETYSITSLLSSTQTFTIDFWDDGNSNSSIDVVPEDWEPWSGAVLAAVVVGAVSIFTAIVVVLVFLIHKKRRHGRPEKSWHDPARYVVDSELLDELTST